MVLLVTAQVPAKPGLFPSMITMVAGGDDPLPTDTVVPAAAVNGPDRRISPPVVLLTVGLIRVLTLKSTGAVICSMAADPLDKTGAVPAN